jgi:hypothetical protein
MAEPFPINAVWVLGAVGSFAVSMLHLWIAWKGASAYRFFGAGEAMALMAEKASPIPALVTLVIALVFAVFGWYALAAARLVAALPLQATVLWSIGSIYTLRGLAVLVELAMLWRGRKVPPQNPWFSLASLSIGLVHLWGLKEAI